MATRIRLLAIDLDGTLLTSDRRLPAAHREAVHRAVKAGIRVVLATGRVYASAARFLNELELDSALVCSNGAFVATACGDEIAHCPLSSAGRDRLLEYGEETGVHLNLYSRRELFFLRETPWCEVYRNRAGFASTPTLTPDEARATDATKILLIDEPEPLEDHVRAVSPWIAEGLFELVRSEPEYVEFVRPGINKGVGLALLAEHYGVPSEQVAAIGDYLNDLEMLQWVGWPGAVANAHPRIREAARIVVSSNESGGVAEFIDSVMRFE